LQREGIDRGRIVGCSEASRTSATIPELKIRKATFREERSCHK